MDATSERLTGLQCLSALFRQLGLPPSAVPVVPDGDDMDDVPGLLARIASESGLDGRALSLEAHDLDSLSDCLPVIMRLTTRNFVVLTSFDAGGDASLIDPLASPPGVIQVPVSRLAERWDGTAVRIARPGGDAAVRPAFGLRWFVPHLLRERKVLSEVGLSAVMLQILGLASPVFFQIVIDKVLIHHATATLHVMLIGVLAALAFESAYTFLRQYLLVHASQRIDIQVATATFRHLLDLPIMYFDRLPAGILAKHMQQGERVRQFLTGRLLLTLMDTGTMVVVLVLLAYYSVALTGVVLGFALVMGGVILVISRPFRSRLHMLYAAEGERQGLLVESIHGIATVKALGLEPRQRTLWDFVAIRAARLGFQVGTLSAIAQALLSMLEKLATITIVAIGANMAFDSLLSVGALVAFMMLAGRVLSPLSQIAMLIHEYQETALSVRMLGEVMNAEPEPRPEGGGLRPSIRGRVQFDTVGFRYPNADTNALSELSLDIAPGQMVGIVGHSGSGKSTLVRLLQGLYRPQDGTIRIDGHDLKTMDMAYLRSSMGVVLQDSFLFRGSIAENIAAGRRGAGLADVVQAARLAGALEFIDRLPRGFDTPLEESATNLSGGQRQRLSIARALIRSPNLLVFDEATSALDPDSERIIQDNLRAIARGRTTIIISHRLSSVTDADFIVVLERGRIVGKGPHADLLASCPLYAKLWDLQSRTPRATNQMVAP